MLDSIKGKVARPLCRLSVVPLSDVPLSDVPLRDAP